MRLSRRAADPRWRRREQRETRWPLPVQCVVPSVQWRCPCPGQVLEGVGDCDIQSSPEAKAAHANGKFALVPLCRGEGGAKNPCECEGLPCEAVKLCQEVRVGESVDSAEGEHYLWEG